MDYEKKYNEALERAQKVKHDAETIGCSLSPDMLEVIFPELADSEDEKIRKALIWHLKADGDFVSNGVTKAECIAYLEKQKEKSEIPVMGGDTDTYFDDLRMTTKPLTSREWFNEGIKYAQRLQKEQKPADLDEAADDYVRWDTCDTDDGPSVGMAKDAFKAGAEWMKAQLTVK